MGEEQVGLGSDFPDTEPYRAPWAGGCSEGAIWGKGKEEAEGTRPGAEQRWPQLTRAQPGEDNDLADGMVSTWPRAAPLQWGRGSC